MSKIAAVMIVRNERNIIALSALHLLNNIKVDRLIIANNGSTDGTRSVLDLLQKKYSQIKWIEYPGVFTQGRIISELGQIAFSEGAEWIIPCDADEFHSIEREKILSLDSNVGLLTMRVKNFVQWRFVYQERPDSVSSMLFSVYPVGRVEEGKRLVEEGKASFLLTRYPIKIIARADKNLTIDDGNHWAHGFPGEVVNTPPAKAGGFELRLKAGSAGRRGRLVTPPGSHRLVRAVFGSGCTPSTHRPSHSRLSTPNSLAPTDAGPSSASAGF